MNTGIKVLCLITLCLVLVGCGTYHAVWKPHFDDSGAMESPAVLDVVATGDAIRVTLLNGRAVEGYFISEDATSLVIEKWQAVENWSGSATETRITLSKMELDQIEYDYNANTGAILFLFGTAVVAADIIADPVQSTQPPDIVEPAR